MNMHQLEYFVAAAETLNFTKAAALCHISQTAMTQQIRSLENIVGVPLFIRDSHHVELTAAGRFYLGEARVILERSNEALKLTRLVSEGLQGELTIGFISGYGQSDFAPILKKFHAQYPGIRLGLLRDNMSVLLDRLTAGECDLVLAVRPYERRHTGLRHQLIKSYPIMAALPEGHALGHRNTLTYADLSGEKFIMMQPSNRPKEQMEESFLIYERGGYMPEITAMEGNPETLLLMISAGMGISLLPEYIVRHYHEDEMLRIVPMVRSDNTAETIDLEASWREDAVNPALEQFLALLG